MGLTLNINLLIYGLIYMFWNQHKISDFCSLFWLKFKNCFEKRIFPPLVFDDFGRKISTVGRVFF